MDLHKVEEKQHYIDIKCEFFTDGDYKVESGRGITAVKDPHDPYHYTIKHTIKASTANMALSLADSMLWELVCGCIKVGGLHHYVLRDFYDGIKELTDEMYTITTRPHLAKPEYVWEMFGNYEGTCITVSYRQEEN